MMETAPLTTYLEHLARGELAFQKAEDGTPVFFPRLVAPGGGHGEGELAPWNASHGERMKPHRPTLRGRRELGPLRKCRKREVPAELPN